MSSLVSSLVMYYIDLYLCHSDQVVAAVVVLAMMLGIALGPIRIFDASNAADADTAVDARSERALTLVGNVTLKNYFP